MVILKAENISKQYRLGVVGTGTLSHDINRWWHKIRGKEDPYLKIGEANQREEAGSSPYVWALKDINFEVQQGEVLGIIGKNGAGKSTLLKILSKVTNPTTGIIKSRGRIASLLEVGTGFHPELTGRENVFLNGAILGMTKAEIHAKLDEIISFSGCERYIDTPVKRYSSGMKVRLAFAVAAHLEPEILVVDEVLAVGDAEFQKKAIGKMQDISRGDGRTVLFVSHNMAAVQSLCTRAIVLEKGRTVFEGNTDSAITFYGTTSVDTSSMYNPKYLKQSPEGITIKNIKIINEDGIAIERILSGQKVIFEIEVNMQESRKPLSMGIGVYDQLDMPYFHCSTETLQIVYDKKEGEFVARLTIEKWPLTEGIYYLNAFLRTGNELIEHVTEALWLFTEKGDFYGSGVLPSWNKGFYIDYEWE
jgi:lipopolysaccharide transport system ATP-binding protein